jgi:PAS domain S-box-containing protein
VQGGSDFKQIQTVFSKISEGFAYCKIVTDEEGKPVDWLYLDVNEAYERINGVKKETVVGKRVTEVLPSIREDPADWINLYGHVALTGEPLITERYAQVRNKWYHISAYSPQRGYFISIFEDITERKRAEEAFTKAKSDWERTFDAVPDFITILDTNYRIIRANQAMAQQLGVSPEKAVGLICYECIHGTTAPPDNCPHAQLLKDGKQQTAELHEPRLGGDFLVSATPLRDEKGILIGSVHVARNITERKKAEEALRTINVELEERVKKRTEDVEKARERLYNVLETLPSYVVLLDKNYYVPFANKVFRERFGESHGKRCYGFLFNRTSPCENCETYKVMKTGKPHRWQWSGPDHRDYEIYDFPFMEADGSKLILEMGVDVTDEKRAMAELEKYRQRLEQLVSERTKLLRESEQRWATTLSSIGDAVIATDAVGKITFLNAVAEKVTGWAFTEAIGQPIKQVFNIVNEKTCREIASPIAQVLEKGVIVGLANHTVLIRKDKTEVPIDDSGAPIKTEDGKTIGVVLVFRDITERRKDEETLRKLNRTLRAISDSNQALMRATDEASFLQQACKIIVKDCGYKMVWVGLAEDDEAKSVHPVASAGLGEDYLKSLNVTWADTERGRGPTGKAIRTGEPQLCQNMRTDPAFQPWREEALKRGFVSSIALPLRSGGKVFGALTLYSTNPGACSQDEIKLLTELAGDFAHGIMMLRLRADKERHEAELVKQAALIDLSPDGIIVKHLDDTITFWSEGAERLYGWTKQEAIGQKASALLRTHSDMSAEKIIDELKQVGKWAGQVTQYTRDGQELAVQSFWLAMVNNSGELEVLESNADITTQKQLQDKLEEKAAEVEEYATRMEELANTRARQLKDAERLAAIGATASMVGHDIRNPLQAITSDMYLISEEAKTMPNGECKQSIMESIDSVNENLMYINKIVSDLQDYTRPLKPNMQNADLAELIQGTVLSINIPKKVEITTEVKDDSKAIKTDIAYLRRILTNLMTNAVQAMQDEGKLTIEARKMKSKVIIVIEDTGIGIPQDVRVKMFTPLFTTKSKGQGLGLAVVKRLVEALGGTIKFDSEENKGTKFTIELPQKE